MMSMAGASSVGALPDPLSMMVRTIFIGAGAISLDAETRPAAGSVNAEVMTGTFRTVTVVASEMTTVGTNFTVLSLAIKIQSVLSSALVLSTDSSTGASPILTAIITSMLAIMMRMGVLSYQVE